MLLVKLAILGILGLICYQDYTERAVSWILFPSLLVGASLLFFNATIWALYLTAISINLILISILFSGIWLYANFKLGIPITKAIGLGDLLFFVVIAFAFAPVSFISLLVFSLLFALITQGLIKSRSRFTSIPLAGHLSVFFGLVYLSSWLGIISNLYVI